MTNPFMYIILCRASILKHKLRLPFSVMGKLIGERKGFEYIDQVEVLVEVALTLNTDYMPIYGIIYL